MDKIEEARKSYLEGNRAPWVEATLAAAYEQEKSARERAEAMLKARWISCSGPSDYLVVDDSRGLSAFREPNPNACHPHWIITRAEYEARLSRCEAVVRLAKRAKEVVFDDPGDAVRWGEDLDAV